MKCWKTFLKKTNLIIKTPVFEPYILTKETYETNLQIKIRVMNVIFEICDMFIYLCFCFLVWKEHEKQDIQ